MPLPNLILIANDDPIHWKFCPKCGKKLQKDIQKECYMVWCKKCGITYRLEHDLETLHIQINAQNEYIEQLEKKGKK